MEIVLVGLNFRTAPVEVREKVSFSGEQAQRASEELRSRGILEETLVLSTCNRSELYGVPGDLAVLDAAAAYVRECGLLPLRAAKTAVTGAVITPFRAVFIEVENSAELREFRERLRDIVGAPPLIPPHISLLYTLDRISQVHRPDLNAAVLAAIAARYAEAIDDTEFILSRPVVNSTG